MKEEWTISEVSKASLIPDRELRRLTQRLPFTPTRRCGRTDFYDTNEVRRMILCMRMQPLMNRPSLVSFFHKLREMKPEFLYFGGFDCTISGVPIFVPASSWLSRIEDAEYES